MPATLSEHLAVSAEMIELLPLEKVHPHPDNPPERMEAAALADLLPLIDEFGQHDPATVRPHPEILGAYQLTSGHRRYACLRLLGRDSIRANVVDLSDTEALQSVVIANAGRKDLDPIQRAEMLDRLVRPIDDGGAGLDRAAAGRMFGLESESGIKNTLRLLALPPSIRTLVVDGTLPVRVARSLIPYAAATVMLDGIAKDLRTNERRMRSRMVEGGKLDAWDLSFRYRPTDGKTKYHAGWEFGGDHPRRFKLDEQTEAKLQIVDLPIGPKGKAIPVAQNVKLFDSLNKPAIKAWRKTHEARGKSKPMPKAGDPAATAEQLAAKAKEQAERLKARTAEWRIQFLRLLLTTQTPPFDDRVLASSPILFAAASTDLSYFLSEAIVSLGGPNLSMYGRDRELLDAALAVPGPTGIAAPCGEVLIDRLWRILLWPGHREGLGGVSEGMPTRFPHVSRELLEHLATACGVSIEDGWRDAATDASPEREMMALWLGFHTVDQLRTLADQLGHVPECGPRKSDLVASLLAAHRTGDPLPLPKLLRPKKSTKKKGAK